MKACYFKYLGIYVFFMHKNLCISIHKFSIYVLKMSDINYDLYQEDLST